VDKTEIGSDTSKGRPAEIYILAMAWI